MPDPTQPSQADEALRQTRAIEEAGDIRQLLTRMADRLTENLPDAAMREVNRLAYAQDYADGEQGYRTPMAIAVERALLRQMPQIGTREITRAEYAVILRNPAGRPTRAERVAELQRQAREDYESRRDRAAAARMQLGLACAHGSQAAGTR
ncbi:hypothetical protein ACIOG7_10475 [Streptomyces sp. NPDC087894]|uniref:hypothetical protein n=1 Tax=Streptomyces sp. NPDC087894 TaxID=3365816 RepID=UPI003804A4F4